MVKHHELSGVELHPAKIAIASPTDRAPAFVGEPIFDMLAGALWVGTSTQENGWQRATAEPIDPSTLPAPLTFSWVIDCASFQETDSNPVHSLAIYFAENGTDLSDLESWDLLATYTIGLTLAYGSAIDVTSLVQAKGKGFYLLLAAALDPESSSTVARSTNFQPSYVNTVSNSASSIVQPFDVPSFAAPNGLTYYPASGFRCLTVLAQVVLSHSAN